MGKINPIALGACVAIAGIVSALLPVMALVFFGIILAAGIMEAKDGIDGSAPMLACAVGMFVVAAIRFALWAM